MIEHADPGRPPELAALLRSLDLYERAPTGDHAADAWGAFAAIDVRLADLRATADETVAGARAVAELDRMELEGFRDRQMLRFVGSQKRLGNALSALQAISGCLRAGEWRCSDGHAISPGV